MSGHTYTYEGGRCINRDGEPFVSIHRSLKPPKMGGSGYANPVDCDVFARLCATAPEMLGELRRLAESFGWPENHPTRAIIRKVEGSE